VPRKANSCKHDSYILGKCSLLAINQTAEYKAVSASSVFLCKERQDTGKLTISSEEKRGKNSVLRNVSFVKTAVKE
jgi:hypothetical protein